MRRRRIRTSEITLARPTSVKATVRRNPNGTRLPVSNMAQPSVQDARVGWPKWTTKRTVGADLYLDSSLKCEQVGTGDSPGRLGSLRPSVSRGVARSRG